MRPASGGVVINVASVAATIAFPGISVYSATKSGVDRLTRVAAMESGKLGYGVRVNCIYPGLVPTAMGAGLANDVAEIGLFGSPEEAVGAVIELTPSGRLGAVEDMADAVVFLASDASRVHQRRRPAGRRRDGDVTMASSRTKPVIVYGASGYTGRLICEYLREYNVPFVAAGRDGGKLKSSMEANVAGIETADYEIVEVGHDPDSLTELFAGASVVCNTVGPFSKHGPAVVEACLASGVHYLDTTGEQDWLITCDEQYGADFAAAGLLLAPGRRADVHDRRDRGRGRAGAARSGHPRHRGVLGRQPDHRLDPDHPGQRGPGRRLLPRAEPATSRGTPRPASTSWRSRASTSWRWRCRGAAPRTRSGTAATRGWPTSRCSAVSSTSR